MTTLAFDASDDPQLAALLERWYERRSSGLPAGPDDLTVDPTLRAAYEAEIAGHIAIEAALGGSSSPPPPPLGVPRRFERLVYHDRGGMGVVFKAWDAELGREVAYKVIKPELVGDREKVDAFLREARITASLQHSGVVPVHALVDDGVGRPAYAMTFIRGRSLTDVVAAFHAPGGPARDKASWRSLIAHLVAACRTVQYAHVRKVLHRDLSPRNILIEGDETFVVDWGLASNPDTKIPLGPEVGEGDRPPTRAGTAAYVAPEVWDESVPRPFGPVSDVYALGALLYLILTGRAPYEGRSTPEVIQKAIASPPPDPRSVNPHAPRPLAAICIKAMARSPEDRYLTAEAMADDLDAWLAGERVAADREPWSEATTRWALCHAVAVAASIVGIVVLASAAVTWTAISQARVQSKEIAIRDREQALASEVASNYQEAHRRFREAGNAIQSGTSTKFLESLIAVLESEDYDRAKAIATLRGLMGRYADLATPKPSTTDWKLVKSSLAGAATRLEELVRNDPSKSKHRNNLADTYILLGFLETSAVGSEAQHRVALDWLAKARSLVLPLMGSSEDETLAREAMIRIESCAHANLIMLGRMTEALISADLCFEMEPRDHLTPSKADRDNYLKAAEVEQSKLPWSRPPNADHAHAIAMANYLAHRERVSDRAVYNTACAFSLASVDDKVDAAERERRAARAVALLDRIGKAGYFADPSHRDEFKADADFTPIRGRADFREVARPILP